MARLKPLTPLPERLVPQAIELFATLWLENVGQDNLGGTVYTSLRKLLDAYEGSARSYMVPEATKDYETFKQFAVALPPNLISIDYRKATIEELEILIEAQKKMSVFCKERREATPAAMYFWAILQEGLDDYRTLQWRLDYLIARKSEIRTPTEKIIDRINVARERHDLDVCFRESQPLITRNYHNFQCCDASKRWSYDLTLIPFQLQIKPDTHVRTAVALASLGGPNSHIHPNCHGTGQFCFGTGEIELQGAWVSRDMVAFYETFLTSYLSAWGSRNPYWLPPATKPSLSSNALASSGTFRPTPATASAGIPF